MTDKDNITLPREVVEKIHEAWSSEVYPSAGSIEWYDIMEALRAALAAPSEDIEALRRENERLREALQALLSLHDDPCAYDAATTRARAKAALRREEV